VASAYGLTISSPPARGSLAEDERDDEADGGERLGEGEPDPRVLPAVSSTTITKEPAAKIA
jgi:hypothetical protein